MRSGGAAVPEVLLDAVVAQFRPRRVILFGSRATGAETAESDWELLVILDDDAPQEALDLRRGARAARQSGIDAEVLACRSSTFERLRHVPGSLPHAAAADGRVVYERRLS